MIIGFCGKKGSGKTYFSNYLVKKFKFHLLSFATPLKEATKIIFNLTDDEVKNPNKKEIIIPRLNASPRQLMQWMGTEVMRENFNKTFNYQGSIWVDNVKEQIKSLLSKDEHMNIVIDDVRFQNEIDMIHELGGIVIQIKLIDNIINETSYHPSENQKLSFDYDMINNKTQFNTDFIYSSLDFIYNDRLL